MGLVTLRSFSFQPELMIFSWCKIIKSLMRSNVVISIPPSLQLPWHVAMKMHFKKGFKFFLDILTISL
jgi:hypothetical protein